MSKWSQSEVYIASKNLGAYCMLCECRVNKGHKFRLFRKGRNEYYTHEDCYDHRKGD